MLKATLVMEYAEVTFDMAQPDMQPALGVSFDLPLSNYTVRARVTAVTAFPVAHMVLTSPAIVGKTFEDVAADLARTDYASNVSARDLSDEADD